MLERDTFGERLFIIFLYTFLALVALLGFLPFWIMIMAAFTDDMALRVYGYLPWISKFSLDAFKWVFSGTQIQQGYLVTVFVTLVGTLSSLFVMSMLAYVMSIKRLKGRNAIAFYVFFTMIFVPGIVPWFLTCRNLLGLKDNIWALILPMMVQPFWVFVLRNFFSWA
jgi:putative aldouronate transport system permease protein